jgi:hypothetical protein
MNRAGWNADTLFCDHMKGSVYGFDSRQGQDFSVLHVVQTVSLAHRASDPMGPGV